MTDTTARHTPGPWQATLVGGVWWVHQADSAPRTRPATFDHRFGMPANVPSEAICSIAGESREADAKLLASAPAMAKELERMRARLDDALFVLGMVDKNNRIDAGAKGKAGHGRFVVEEVRRVLALGPNAPVALAPTAREEER